MTADIISLRRARKAKARADREARAEQNRIAHGRTKAELRHVNAVRQLQEKRLDSMMISEPIPTQDDKTHTAD